MNIDGAIIGKHIRKLRRRQHRTLQEIAVACDFSKSLLSKIETGKIFPPIATLVKIANALGTRVTTLIEDSKSIKTVYTKKDESFVDKVKTENGYYIFPFATEHKEKQAQPFLFFGKKGEVKEHSVTHEGEEFIFVIKGEMQFRVGDIQYTLKEGDSLYFDALDEHGFLPISEEVYYIDIFV